MLKQQLIMFFATCRCYITSRAVLALWNSGCFKDQTARYFWQVIIFRQWHRMVGDMASTFFFCPSV